MADDTRSEHRPFDPRTKWAELSQAERDAAYDNNGAVKNSAALIAERNEASARLRGALKSHLDLPYGTRANNKIDLYPASRPDAPCLVFVHGGYWQRNSRELFAMLVEGVAAHGWSVAIPGYSLAPEVSLSDIVAVTISPCWNRKRTTSPALRLSFGPRSCAVEPRSMMTSPSGIGALDG